MSSKQIRVEFTMDRAVQLYRTLRTQGTSSTMARISVLSRCTDLLPQQRRHINQVLQQLDVKTA